MTGARTVVRLAVATLLSTALTACLSTPMPNLRVELPPHWQQPSAQDVAAPASDPWWSAFDDARLDALIKQALSDNLDVGQARAKLRGARALARVAGTELRPDLHFRTSAPTDPDARASYVVIGFDSQWELGLFGRSEALQRIAHGARDSALADLDDAQLSVAAEVARQWITLRAAQQRVNLLKEIEQQRVDQVRLTDARVAVKLASPQEAAKARATAREAAMAVAEPKVVVTASAQALALLLGRAEPDSAWFEPGPVPWLRGVALDSVPADLLRQRPDVLHAQAAVVSAAGELGLARAERWPSVAIGGSIVRSINEAERVNTHTSAIGSIGPIIDIPLFDWGLRRAKARAKDAALEASVFAYRKSVLSAAAEVEVALATLDAQRVGVQQATQAFQALQEVERATLRRKALGLASAFDVADSDIVRSQGSIQLANVEADHALAYVALCKALGGGPRATAVPGAIAASSDANGAH